MVLVVLVMSVCDGVVVLVLFVVVRLPLCYRG